MEIDYTVPPPNWTGDEWQTLSPTQRERAWAEYRDWEEQQPKGDGRIGDLAIFTEVMPDGAVHEERVEWKWPLGWTAEAVRIHKALRAPLPVMVEFTKVPTEWPWRWGHAYARGRIDQQMLTL